MTLKELLGALWHELKPPGETHPLDLNELLEVLYALLRRED